jgi:GTP-binding protein HflX
MREKKKSKFLLVSIIPQHISDEQAFIELRELKDLVDTYGGKVDDWVLQHREVHDKGSYIGEGKIKEASTLIKKRNIDVVVLNAIVKPSQLYDLKTLFMRKKATIEVWDRVDLILHIFSRHAKTAEAKLQIELAAMRHMGPRIYGMGMVLSRQTGGIGTRGVGETNTELMKRHWRTQIKKVNEKLEKLSRERERQLDRRRKIGLKTVSLVGYTNAGKTSLFNKLTKKSKLAEDALFATLDSSVGRLAFPSGGQHNEALISDTIGFIRNLPADLIEAFKSTLMESIHADLLLHVIDSTDENIHGKIAVVERVLRDLGLDNKEKIYVFNKIDGGLSASTKEILLDRYARFSPHFISVKTDEGIISLRDAIEPILMKTQVLEHDK